MARSNFWADAARSNKLMRELKVLKSTVEPYENSSRKLKELAEFCEIAHGDQQLIQHLNEELLKLKETIGVLEMKAILGSPFDQNNCILSINAGAGGTESCDWANMLLRMYTRWVDNKGFKLKTLDILPGEEAGIKNVTIRIEGEMAYGLLKSEKGVHRLVRISPFDANKRRHTSFASVDVIPEVEDDVEVEIKPDDLRIDVYRSSGPGGQSVNTTDSAVRITHIPSGIVVQCQNERSQLQNRQTAMKVLRAKLYERKAKEQQERMKGEYGEKQKIEWGSQIRSYVMHPYSMVKDHRSEAQTPQAQKVMDGDIDMFIDAYLKMKRE